MPSRRHFLLSAATGLTALAAVARWRGLPSAAAAADSSLAANGRYEVTHTDAEWRRLLTPAQYAVLREGDTERPYSSPLNDEHRAGIFACAGCGLHL